MYNVPLNERAHDPRSFKQVAHLRFERWIVSDVHVSRNIVAAAIARFTTMFSPPTYRIFLLNTTTGTQVVVDPHLPEVSFNLITLHIT